MAHYVVFPHGRQRVRGCRYDETRSQRIQFITKISQTTAHHVLLIRVHFVFEECLKIQSREVNKDEDISLSPQAACNNIQPDQCSLTQTTLLSRLFLSTSETYSTDDEI